MDLGNSYNNVTFLAWIQMSAVRNPALYNACWERAEHSNATGQACWEGEKAKNHTLQVHSFRGRGQTERAVHAYRLLPRRCPQYTIQGPSSHGINDGSYNHTEEITVGQALCQAIYPHCFMTTVAASQRRQSHYKQGNGGSERSKKLPKVP